MAIPWAAIAAGAQLIPSILSLFKKKKKSFSSSPEFPMIDIPPFFEDPYYKPSQDYLFGFGKDPT